jgi:hypothetical protein
MGGKKMNELIVYHGGTEIVEHQPNNQMCLLSQEITDKYMTFDGTENI